MNNKELVKENEWLKTSNEELNNQIKELTLQNEELAQSLTLANDYKEFLQVERKNVRSLNKTVSELETELSSLKETRIAYQALHILIKTLTGKPINGSDKLMAQEILK